MFKWNCSILDHATISFIIEINIVRNIRPLIQFYTLCFDSDILMYENDKSSQYGKHNNL